jgi:hypothetical protein
MVKSNQRITKIKRDPIEELLKKAEAMDVEDGCQVQPQGMDLTPYPDMSSLRLWVHDYLLKGLNVIYNNELSIDGQTYMTTIVDGLPLFTKLSKTIKQKAIGTQFEQPVLTEDGTIGGSSFAVNGLPAIGNELYVMTNPDEGYYYYGGYLPNQQFTYYNPDAIKLTSITFNNVSIPSNIEGDILKTFKLEASNDNSDWITIGTYSRTNSVAGSGNDNVEITTEYAFKYFRFTLLEAFNGNINKQAVSYCRLNGIIENGIANVETSKPGLWLSNLCEPYQVSQAGGWLRQNLINDYYKEYTNLNSDTIGNYSFSYFQRGIIHRDAGSTHADNDSYCQHWSPSALGCISHDSLIIPTNNLRNTYTSYQTLAVPSAVDKQSYSETISKDVEFTFVDNNNNIPLSTTTFNGRVVGDGWQYEFVFEPNYGGSGNNYGETEEDVPNGSNGGCVTGQITYQLDNGDTCVQSIDKCFVTDQALFNPYNHSTGDALGGNNTFIMPIGISGEGVNGTLLDELPINGKYYIASLTGSCNGSGKVYLINDDGTHSTTSQSWNYETWAGSGNCRPRPFGISHIGHSCNNCGTCYVSHGCGSGTLYLTEKLEPQTNVTIYLNIWDLQKEYAAQGLPWAYTCEYDRFRVEISTQPCSDWYCKSFVIAKNVNINDLGDISALQRIVFSGG